MYGMSPCPTCGSSNLYKSKSVSAGGGYAPDYLPGLGGLFSASKFHLVLCKGCGLTRFFAEPEAIAKVSNSSKWTRV